MKKGRVSVRFAPRVCKGLISPALPYQGGFIIKSRAFNFYVRA
jgi:hypothetical protein